jgi:hypothetical protein
METEPCTKSSNPKKKQETMKTRAKIAGLLAGVSALMITTGARAQSTATATNTPSDADVLLNMFQKKGVISSEDANQAREALAANHRAAEDTNSDRSFKFKIGNAIKSMELFGDLRFRYEYRAAELGQHTTPAGANYGDYDAANRLRYALRVGVRGDLTDDFYYGLRLETSPNERSTWNTFGNAGGGQSPYYGPFSKANNYTVYVGLAYLGWRPAPWLDVSIGRVPQPLYTTPMVWDSDYTPEGAVEKLKYTVGPADLFTTFGQFVYQDTTPGSGTAIFAGSPGNAYLLSWQAGLNYHIKKDVSAKIAPVLYDYLGNGNGSAGFAGPFVGQGEPDGLQYTGAGTSSSTLPGAAAGSFNQTGINNLFVFELPEEVNFKLGSLDAKVFGDFAVNVEGRERASAAFNAGKAQGAVFPGGAQLNQDKAYQFGMAVGNNMGLNNGATPKKGTWEARAYWQHVEQYALDPNLLDSDFFEGRGNMEGLFTAFSYSVSDAIIGTVRYGWAEQIDKKLGTGGFNADLPLPNPISKYQILQLDVTWKF